MKLVAQEVYISNGYQTLDVIARLDVGENLDTVVEEVRSLYPYDDWRVVWMTDPCDGRVEARFQPAKY